MDRRLIILLVAALALAVVNAAAFAYYDVSLSLAPTAPPVYFAEGDNANEPDLGGGGTPYTSNVIEVAIGDASTSLSITVHPTYRRVYYHNVSLIINQDGKAYNLWLRVETPLDEGKIQSATLYVKDSSGTTQLTVNLKATGTTGPAQIPAGGKWYVDVEIQIDATGGSYDTPPFASDSASLELIYSPSSESPP